MVNYGEEKRTKVTRRKEKGEKITSMKTKRRRTIANSFISIYNFSDFIFRTAVRCYRTLLRPEASSFLFSDDSLKLRGTQPSQSTV